MTRHRLNPPQVPRLIELTQFPAQLDVPCQSISSQPQDLLPWRHHRSRTPHSLGKSRVYFEGLRCNKWIRQPSSRYRLTRPKSRCDGSCKTSPFRPAHHPACHKGDDARFGPTLRPPIKAHLLGTRRSVGKRNATRSERYVVLNLTSRC
jgi:hypothetical protein